MQRFDAVATEELLDYPSLVATVMTVLEDHAKGGIISPERLVLPGDDGILLSMPCRAEDLIVHKLLTVYGGNREQALPTIQGELTCFDASNGVPLFCLDAVTATARRTAALTMVGIRLLRPAPPSSCLLIGTGTQAQAHVAAMLELYPEMMIHVQGRSRSSATAFCHRIARPDRVIPAFAPETDLVITLTTSPTPVYDVEPSPNRLVIGVGSYRPDIVEIGPSIVRGSQLYVDDMAGAAHEAGDILAAGVDWTSVRSLATALVQRPDDERPVFFKTVGCAAWDLAACRVARSRLSA